MIILYFLVRDQNLELFFIIILIPIFIFLFFNYSLFKLPKIFLGDSGSLYLGFVISFILIYFAIKDLAHPILLAWSIAIFVYEFLSINFIRVKKKKNPFKAGKDHLHHLIFKITNSNFLTNFFICLTNLILFLIGYLAFILINPLASLISFIIFFLIFLILRIKYSIKIFS
jgi:UDP-GlcNAc:undecaprenyl-phosphate GlcNAc-1-phosphate transferase